MLLAQYCNKEETLHSIVLKAYNISSLLQYCAKSNTMFPFYYSVMLQAYNVLFLLQCCATSIQCSYGLYNSSHIDVELWCGWYGLYSLEGTQYCNKEETLHAFNTIL
jgi:hypothetical protein